MNNELKFSRKIRDLLNEGLDLGIEKNARLRAIREQVLARHRASAGARLPVWSGRGSLALLGTPEEFLSQLVLPVAVMIVIAFGFGAWQKAGTQRAQFLELQQHAKEVAEIDAGVLTSELPLDAYLDEGFVAWLENESEAQ